MITLNKTQMSDLFFNHEHPEYDALFTGKDNVPREDMEEAIKKDAKAFANSFGGDAEWYAADFMKRL